MFKYIIFLTDLVEQPSQAEGDDYRLYLYGSVWGKLTGVNGGTTSLKDSVILRDSARFCKKYRVIEYLVERAPGKISGWLDSWIGKMVFNRSNKQNVLRKMKIVKNSNC